MLVTLSCSSPVMNAEENIKSSHNYCGNCVQPTPISFTARFDNGEELPAAELIAGFATADVSILATFVPIIVVALMLSD